MVPRRSDSVTSTGPSWGFASSFFVISIACDYRYLYFTDIAAMAGLVYAAVDPTFFGRRARVS